MPNSRSENESNLLLSYKLPFIVLGWTFALNGASSYLFRKVFIRADIKSALSVGVKAIIILVVLYIAYYLYKQYKNNKTQSGVILRAVWASLLIMLMLINLILFNVMHEINYELQHALFMTAIAFAILITGVILKYRWLLVGSAIFAALAYASSLMDLEHQLLFEAIGWALAFALPGHLIKATLDKKTN